MDHWKASRPAGRGERGGGGISMNVQGDSKGVCGPVLCVPLSVCHGTFAKMCLYKEGGK